MFNIGSFDFFSGSGGTCTIGSIDEIKWIGRSSLAATFALLMVLFNKVSFGLFFGVDSACAVGSSDEIEWTCLPFSL